MDRRRFLLSPLAAVPAVAQRRYRVGVIGHSGRGGFGHGIGDVWKAFPQTEVVAVADPDPDGRAEAQERTGAAKAYADYRELLAKERPDIVSVCPRHTDQRLAMVTAAADAGCHMYCEKPFAPNLADADRMVAAIRRAGVRVQIAHQMRTSPLTLAALRMVEEGELGEIHELRGRGKEDSRAGGEDLVVLGSHIFDMMRAFLGDPEWVFAQVGEQGKDLDAGQLRTPTEPIGPIAARQIAAMFSFGSSVHGYFSSKESSATHEWRFGTHVYGSKGTLFLPNEVYSEGSSAFVLRSPAWVPDEKHAWEPIEAKHRTFGSERHLTANALMVEDLLDAIESEREPLCSERAGRWTVEMTQGVYASQLRGGPVPFPLRSREHPLEGLAASRI